jgi:hypothetical protein
VAALQLNPQEEQPLVAPLNPQEEQPLVALPRGQAESLRTRVDPAAEAK